MYARQRIQAVVNDSQARNVQYMTCHDRRILLDAGRTGGHELLSAELDDAAALPFGVAAKVGALVAASVSHAPRARCDAMHAGVVRSTRA